MKAVHLGVITTGTVVLLSVFAVVPAFTQQNTKPAMQVMLVFDINDQQNLPAWCSGVAGSLKSSGMPATVFITGKIAEQYEPCVTVFSANKDVDIGSKTYSHVNLTSITDYTQAFDEVRKGKEAVDRVGNLDSRLFRAPYGLTDENIYSMLSRSGIVADFSYETQYNKYSDGSFLRYDITSYKGTALKPEFLQNLESRQPILISFDNSVPVNEIDEFISRIVAQSNQYNSVFVKASDLTHAEVTRRMGA